MALDFDLLATHCGVDWSDRRGGKIWLRWLASMALLSPQAPYKRKWLPFTSFGGVARGQCGMQCQYAARYIDEIAPDLRFIGNVKDYHSILIHEDDVKEFVNRLRKHRQKNGSGWQGVPA